MLLRGTSFWFQPQIYLKKIEILANILRRHISWRAIQIGIRNITSGGFIDVAHQHPLPSGQINTDNGKL